MRHKLYLLVIALVFAVGMFGLQGCFEEHYSGPGYGYGYPAYSYPAYSYAPSYPAYNYAPVYRNGYRSGYNAGERHEEHEEHEGHEQHDRGRDWRS